MCITFFYIDRNENSKIKFVMVHNREENFSRPTSVLGQFEEDKNIFGGRDLKEQGTWLGFNAKTQNLAFLTNRFSWMSLKDKFIAKVQSLINKENQDTMISRGKLIQEFISSDFKEKFSISDGDNSALRYGQTVFQNRNKFNPFNLLVANFKDMEFIFQGNYDRFPPVSLRDGYHTFCNHQSFEQQAPKQVVGLKRFKDIVEDVVKNENKEITAEIQKENEKVMIKNIHELMENQQRHYSLHFLPIMNESSLFIKPYYSYMFRHYRGTRTSTVIVLNDKNELSMSENTYYQNFLEQPSTNIKINIQL